MACDASTLSAVSSAAFVFNIFGWLAEAVRS
jgi:hypothetical protein